MTGMGQILSVGPRVSWSEEGQDRPLPPANASSFRLASFLSTSKEFYALTRQLLDTQEEKSLLLLVMIELGCDAQNDGSHFSRQLEDKAIPRMDAQRVGKHLVFDVVLSHFPTFPQAFPATWNAISPSQFV